MAFEKFNKDMKIISALDDEPNDVGGLTAAELKAKFDEGGEAIKRYLHDTLIPAVVADGATEEHRAEAEAARVAAEQTRQSNEQTRQANETLRISAELSAVTSVAVFMPPLLSSAKYCWPKPHSSPSSARATSNALRSGSMRMLGL